MQLHYIDVYGMILSMKTQNNIKGLKNLEDKFDFGNLDETHELFSNKNKKKCKYKIETLKKIYVDDFIALRSKLHAYKCGDDSNNKIKGISKS